MPLLGVLGWPVAHSRSPAMHNAALADMGLPEWHYQRLPVPPELFAETVRGLGGAGFAGANVTIPHKRAALELADNASDAARAIGAANTLSFAADGTIAAENTDAPGLIAALQRAGYSPAGRTALVLGAGGSARAAVWALRTAGAAEVLVCNRTHARAVVLADTLGARAVEWPVSTDILVNCTSVGLTNDPGQSHESDPNIEGPGSRADPGQSHESLVRPATGGESDLNLLGLTLDLVGRYSYVVDLVYRTEGGQPSSTPLLAAARERGVPTLDGLEMLVAQGALSLELWTGRPAPVDVMRRAVHAPA
jgi:shikimate dehydrogenase